MPFAESSKNPFKVLNLEERAYPPERQRGINLHISLILLSLAVSGICIWRAVAIPTEPGLLLWSLAALTAGLPAPFLVYRLYALFRGNYLLSREVFTIRWGLRLEQMPVSDVEWVRSANDLSTPLRLPAFPMTGAVLGTRQHPDLGLVEFMAGDRHNLLLVATARRVFAISPRDPVTFAQDFQRMIEMGSLAEETISRSQYPSFVVIHAWENKLTRWLWLAGTLFNLALLIWVSLLVPRLGTIALGFITPDLPRNLVPGIQLIVLPVISMLFFLTAWVVGLVYYRRPNMKPLAFLLWGFSSFSGLLSLVAVGFIISRLV